MRSLRPRRAGGSAPTAASKVTESESADPVQHILATFHIHKVNALLMGGQACILYGAGRVQQGRGFRDPGRLGFPRMSKNRPGEHALATGSSCASARRQAQ